MCIVWCVHVYKRSTVRAYWHGTDVRIYTNLHVRACVQASYIFYRIYCTYSHISLCVHLYIPQSYIYTRIEN